MEPTTDDYRTPEWLAWESFPWEGDLRPKPLQAPQLPEEPRSGEGGKPCGTCARADERYLWVDDDWRISAPAEPEGIPAVLFVEPRAHHDLMDLPPALTASMGLILQRAEAAIHAIGGIGRVHFARWGDGGAHLHWWLFARPAGYRQLRGSFLPFWADLIPALPQEEWDRNIATIAAAMARGGGRAMR